MRAKRDRESYVIEAALNALKVLEALEGARFEGVKLQRVAQRTGLSVNFCFRALKTLQVMGYARETAEGWKLGGRLLMFSESFNKAVEPAERLQNESHAFVRIRIPKIRRAHGH